MNKRELEELKKLDKIIKKDKNEMEDVAGPGAQNIKVVNEKIIRTITNMRKMTKEHNRIVNDREKLSDEIQKSKDTVTSSLKKK